jgi:recombination protein RecR
LRGGASAVKERSMASQEIEALSQALARLPGLGPRSARRAVLHLMKKRETALQPLLAALQNVSDKLSTCSICGNVDTSDPCSICRDQRRDEKMLCVVEEVADLWALDRSRLFPGRYHVLGGRLSALDGVGPEDLSIDRLVRRVSEGGIDEVVLAMNATLEGQTTAHYLAERLEGFPIRLSQLAHGLPVGGELDYLDEGTLAQALRARRPISRFHTKARSHEGDEIAPTFYSSRPGVSACVFLFVPSCRRVKPFFFFTSPREPIRSLAACLNACRATTKSTSWPFAASMRRPIRSSGRFPGRWRRSTTR